MPFYTTPVSKLKEADLQDLLTDGAVENLRLEFKSKIPGEKQTLKKLCSFANTYGGVMLVGAEEKDGKITNLCGVDEEPGYKQRIANWSFIKFNPPLAAEVSEPIRLTSGKFCYVISVPESELAPHFINGRKGVWIRTDEFTNRFRAELANENELRALLDRRRAVRERRDFNLQRARERFDAHIASRHTDAGGNLTKVGPILELRVTPRFPARQLCLQGELQQHLNQAAFRWRGVQFLGAGSQAITAYESVIVRDRLNVGSTSMFSVDVWGYMLLCDSGRGRRDQHRWSEFHRHSSSIGQRIGYGFSPSRRQNTQTARVLRFAGRSGDSKIGTWPALAPRNRVRGL